MRKKVAATLLAGMLVIAMTACSTQSQTEENQTQAESSETDQSLIVYFSRWGNTDYADDVDATTSASMVIDNNDTYGTTEFVARMIQEQVGGDLHLIQTEEAYPTDFDELRDLNHEEMAEGYLPPLVESDLDLEQYDTVFIGYPVWATEVPQAVLSFLDAYDLSGKTVIPFCTHDGYGAGNSYETIAQASHAQETLDGLAIESEDVPDAEDTVVQWLSEIGVQTQVSENTVDEEGQTAIQITIGDTVLDGVIYDTELAKEIQEEMPLTVSMSGYGGREYYGSIDFTPQNAEGGQLSFENGDITYCSTNNSMAIFYAQTDHSDLTMK